MTNLTQLQCLVLNRAIENPFDFWTHLGNVFKLFYVMQPDKMSLEWQLCAIMRLVSLHLFNAWKANDPESFADYQIAREAELEKLHEQKKLAD